MGATRAWHYTRSELVDALRSVGLGQGDIVLSHIGLGFLGFAREAATPKETYQLLYDAFVEVLSDTGTWVVPTYTYSYCNEEIYDPSATPSGVGPFTEYFRDLPGVARSDDPIFSVAVLGPRASEIIEELPHDCFGVDSVYDRLHRLNAKICNVGVGFRYATFVHHVEDILRVPYRYRKLFTGLTRRGDRLEREAWVYNVRILGLGESGHTQLRRLEPVAFERGLCKMASVGRGQVTCITCADMWTVCAEGIGADPWCLVDAREADLLAVEEQRVGRRTFDVHLPSEASMGEMLDALWPLPRDLISDGYEAALDALATQVPMTIHAYASGTQCWTWIVPEKWGCQEAYLETLDGRRLFSYADNPLHVVSYSLPFEGEVERDELLQHLHVHPKIPDATPFIFKYYDRDWGLCCSQRLRDTLTDARYRVVIKSTFSYGMLKIGEIVARGKSDQCIYLCAHLCHPAQVNDDMAGVVVAIGVMRALLQRADLRYTYKLLLLPETIGSVAYLSHHEDVIPTIKGGLFLEMLGLDNPHILQSSLHGDTEMDQCFSLAVKCRDLAATFAPFMALNDERQFNAPGVGIPMLALYRILPRSDPDWPYREYHSDHDSPALVSPTRLTETRDLVLAMIDTLEANRVPVNQFKGEVFLSRYGLHIDWYDNPEHSIARFNIMYLLDGAHSIADIAERLELPFDTVRDTVAEFERHGLVTYQ